MILIKLGEEMNKLKQYILGLMLIGGMGLPAWANPVSETTTESTITERTMNHSTNHPIVTTTSTEYQLPTARIHALIQQAKKHQLAKQPTWQRLLYRHEKKQGRSQVDYAGFFIHAQGKTRFDLELESSIRALFEIQPDNQSFRCRFPARSAWLMQQLNIQADELPIVQCSEFEQWFKTIQPHRATLIFASDYMGSAGSMFGHTLLRFDPEHYTGKDLVSFALNYAAVVPPNENQIAYAWRGLTGRYPAEFSMMKYFHKVKEYGDFESRDLWEYELDLSPEEVQQLVRHVWELKNVRIPYYFMDDNCSYALLGLIDLLRPNLNLQKNFKMTAVPIETVKAVERAKLIKSSHYRPALETQLLAQAQQHSIPLAKVAHQLAVTDVDIQQHLANYSPQQQAQLLEMAYDDLYLHFVRQKVEQRFAQARLRQLLMYRSKIQLAKQRIDVQRPSFDPTQGHQARMWSLQIGESQNQRVWEIGTRVAYHDLLDRTAGYRQGTQLLFLNGAVQWRDGQLKLSDTDILSVHTLNPVTPFKTPLSWGFDLGWKREAIDSKGKFSQKEQHGVLNISTQAGYSKMWSDDKLLCSAQTKIALQAGQALEKGWRAGIAPVAQCLFYWSDDWQQRAEFSPMYWHDSQKWQWNMIHQLQYSWSPQHALRLDWKYQQQEGLSWEKWLLGYRHYY